MQLGELDMGERRRTPVERPRRLPSLRQWIPAGRGLPPLAWERRHRGIVALLWAHAVGLTAFGLIRGVGLTGVFEVVAEAADGAEAITQAGVHQPDLVVLDLSMPVLDGLEALPLIIEAAPGTRVVVLSGFSADKMEQAALDAGAIGYLEKGDIIAVSEALQTLV